MAGVAQKQQAAAAAGAGFNGTLTNAAGAGGLESPATGKAQLG